MWFKSNKDIRRELSERERRMIDCEIELYRKERDFEVDKKKETAYLEIDRMAAEYRNGIWKDIEVLALKSAKQTAEYEHQFHNDRQEKGIELAKLDAVLEQKGDMVKDLRELPSLHKSLTDARASFEGQRVANLHKDKIIEALKEQLERADENLKVIIGKLSTVDIDKINLNAVMPNVGHTTVNK